MSVRGAQQVANDPSGTRMVDSESGIQSVRGSQRVGEGFFSSAFGAYANLLYHPVAAGMLVLAVFILFAELHSTDGPLELAVNALHEYIKDKSHPGFLRNLAQFVITLITLIIKHKIFVATVSLIWFTVVSKPSGRTITYAVIITLAVIFIKKCTVLEILILSQLFFLFVNLRTPSHKFMIAALFAAIFFTQALDVEKAAKGHPYLKSMQDLTLEKMEKDSMARFDSDQASIRAKYFWPNGTARATPLP